MSPDRMKLLVWVLVLLAAIKFVVFPWRDQLSESAEALQILTQRLDRSMGVVLNKEKILATRDELRKSNTPIANLFPLSAGDAEAQLAVQGTMDSALQRHGLKLGLFDWAVTNVDSRGVLRYSRFQLQTTGETSVLARFLADLETGSPHVVIREIVLQPQSLLRGPSTGDRAELRVVADVYFRIEATK
jgi:hypothetical protein